MPATTPEPVDNVCPQNRFALPSSGMGNPGKKDELLLAGVALLVLGCGLVLLTGFMAVLMIDGFREHAGELTGMFATAVAVLLGGIACIVVATVRAARRDRANRRPAPHDADPD